MSLKGEISLVRALADHAVWQSDLAVRGAWIDLLLRANNEHTELLQRGESVSLKRGQLAWSVKGLASKWQVCEEKAAKILGWLQKIGCIHIQSNRRRTVITICNYDVYQAPPVTDSVTDSVPESETETLTEPMSDSVPWSDTGSVTGSVTASAQRRGEEEKRRHTHRAGETPEWVQVEAFALDSGVALFFARDWFERKVNNLTHGFDSLRDWRFDLLTFWRRQGAGKKPGENAVVNGARAKSLGAEIMDAERTRKRLVEQMAEHPCNELSSAYDPESDEEGAWRALRAAHRAAEAILRSIPRDAVESWMVRLRKEAFQRELSQHPGNPQSAAYDEAHCTPETLEEFRALRREAA